MRRMYAPGSVQLIDKVFTSHLQLLFAGLIYKSVYLYPGVSVGVFIIYQPMCKIIKSCCYSPKLVSTYYWFAGLYSSIILQSLSTCRRLIKKQSRRMKNVSIKKCYLSGVFGMKFGVSIRRCIWAYLLSVIITHLSDIFITRIVDTRRAYISPMGVSIRRRINWNGSYLSYHISGSGWIVSQR